MTIHIVEETFAKNPKCWLQAKAGEHDLTCLLAYADDGVIWGRLTENGELTLSGDAFEKVAVELRARTLQQVRLFGPEGELFLWRADGSFSYRIIADGKQKPKNALEDNYWLWGTGYQTNGAFTMMKEGRQGFFHAPPLKDAAGKRGGLRVRHYVEFDQKTGQAYISHSRLVGLKEV
ncbi:MAG: TIGR03984 family CRISPR-associated protein [Chloroflexi bacterium]|nr:TIGR03984 family CRISPR-associated protein [Chloroflexota bacterium]